VRGRPPARRLARHEQRRHPHVQRPRSRLRRAETTVTHTYTVFDVGRAHRDHLRRRGGCRVLRRRTGLRELLMRRRARGSGNRRLHRHVCKRLPAADGPARNVHLHRRRFRRRREHGTATVNLQGGRSDAASDHHRLAGGRRVVPRRRFDHAGLFMP
jgi:hypothetical protein